MLRRFLSPNLFKVSFLSMATSTDSGSTPSTHSTALNRLNSEKSPYLLQHATNPVDWYPWGKEAFDKAKSENKPIFLSVGYSTCHWCHVMERESFENVEIAQQLNRNFVSIKVDREERPDVDKVYMTFVQATQGGGGWPMSVFLTPDLKPFMGGTYFPPFDSFGRPGFSTILRSISDQWRLKRDLIIHQGSKIIDALSKAMETSESDASVPGAGCIQRGYETLEKRYDHEHGGFGNAPKFPQPTILNFLLRVYSRYPNSPMGENALKMTLSTLKAMANGGMHDHVGQGFHRYSTDKFWHVPHFEKMLYDQGQLASIYASAFQISGDEFFKTVLEDILLYVTRDLGDKDGGYYSAEDADSYHSKEVGGGRRKKKEGAFCVWTYKEISSLLAETISSGAASSSAAESDEKKTLSELFCHHYGVKNAGNVAPEQDPHKELSDQNVLIVRGSVAKTAEFFQMEEGRVAALLKQGREKLFEQRQHRPKPHRDDKILTAWNGLMMSGFARASVVLKQVDYLEKAEKIAFFIKCQLYDDEKGTLIRNAYRDSNGDLVAGSVDGFADDYAFLIGGLLDLFEASQQEAWLEWAWQLQQKMTELFWDKDNGGFFSTTAKDPSILLRLKEDQDGAEPSPNSYSTLNLLRLSAYLPGKVAEPAPIDIIKTFGEMLSQHPIALPEMLSAFIFHSQTPKQIIITGEPTAEDTRALLDVVNSFFLPNKILILHDKSDTTSNRFLSQHIEVLSTVDKHEGKATAYVCENYTCTAPITDPISLKKLLNPKISS